MRTGSIFLKAMLFLLLFSSSVLAQSNSSSGSRFYFAVAGKGMLGTTESEDSEIVKSRSSYVFGGEATFGMSFSGFLIGVTGEYNSWKQKTKPSDVSDTNASGTQINIAPVLGFAFSNFLFSVKPYLYSKFDLSKADSDGNKQSYTTPDLASFGLQLIYLLGKYSFIGAEYSKVQYKKVVIDGNEADLSDDGKVTFSALGVVYGFKF